VVTGGGNDTVVVSKNSTGSVDCGSGNDTVYREPPLVGLDVDASCNNVEVVDLSDLDLL
jgi:hypothetical protein